MDQETQCRQTNRFEVANTHARARRPRLPTAARSSNLAALLAARRGSSACSFACRTRRCRFRYCAQSKHPKGNSTHRKTLTSVYETAIELKRTKNTAPVSTILNPKRPVSHFSPKKCISPGHKKEGCYAEALRIYLFPCKVIVH